MDAKENVEEQRVLADAILNHKGNVARLIEDGERLAELVVAQDEWRRKGGFDPYNVPNPECVCVCGHTGHWHGYGGAGSCEYNSDCGCEALRLAPS